MRIPMRSLLVFLAFAAVHAYVEAQEAASTVRERSPIPNNQELERAMQEVHQFYDEEISKAHSRSSEDELVQSLVSDAAALKKDPLAEYALLKTAESIAVKNGSIANVVDVARSIASRFEIGEARAITSSLLDLEKTKRRIDREERIAFAYELLIQIDPLLDSGDIEFAIESARTATGALRKSREFVAYRDAKKIVEDLEAIKIDRTEYLDALDRIKKEELDTQARLQATIGEYTCLVLNDWDEGLRHLQLGEPSDIQMLAAKTLANQDNKELLLGLADNWWHFSQDLHGRKHRTASQYAATLYEVALDKLEGESKDRADSRIRAASEMSPFGKGVASLGNHNNRKTTEAGAGKILVAQKNAPVEFTVYGNVNLDAVEINVRWPRVHGRATP